MNIEYYLAEVVLSTRKINIHSIDIICDSVENIFKEELEKLVDWLNSLRNGFGLDEQEWELEIYYHSVTTSTFMILAIAAELSSGGDPTNILNWAFDRRRICLDVVKAQHSLWNFETNPPDPRPIQLKSSLGGCSVGGNTLDMLSKINIEILLL